jgi:hypothetical protein
VSTDDFFKSSAMLIYLVIKDWFQKKRAGKGQILIPSGMIRGEAQKLNLLLRGTGRSSTLLNGIGGIDGKLLKLKFGGSPP